MFLTIITAVRFVSFTIADLQIDYNLKVSDVWFVGEKVVNLKGHNNDYPEILHFYCTIACNEKIRHT